MNYINSIVIEPNTPVSEYILCDFRNDTKKVRKCKFINDFNSVFEIVIEDNVFQSTLKDAVTFEFPTGIQLFKVSPLDMDSSYIHLSFIVEEWGN